MRPTRTLRRRSTVAIVTATLSGMVLIGGCVPQTKPKTEITGVDTYVQAAMFYRQGDYDRAIPLLEKAVTQNPDLRMPQVMLGSAYRAQGKYEQAAKFYERAGELDPYTAANHYNLGVTYQFLNRLRDAAAAYLKALALDPQDVKSNMNLGLVYLALGQVDDSVTSRTRHTPGADQCGGVVQSRRRTRRSWKCRACRKHVPQSP